MEDNAVFDNLKRSKMYTSTYIYSFYQIIIKFPKEYMFNILPIYICIVSLLNT